MLENKLLGRVIIAPSSINQQRPKKWPRFLVSTQLYIYKYRLLPRPNGFANDETQHHIYTGNDIYFYCNNINNLGQNQRITKAKTTIKQPAANWLRPIQSHIAKQNLIEKSQRKIKFNQNSITRDERFSGYGLWCLFI